MRGDLRDSQTSYGAVENGAALTEAAKAAGGGRRRWSSAFDPVTLGVLAAAGEWGADVAVGEGQSLGNRLDYGGPSFGFFTATEDSCGACRGESQAKRPTSTAAAASC